MCLGIRCNDKHAINKRLSRKQATSLVFFSFSAGLQASAVFMQIFSFKQKSFCHTHARTQTYARTQTCTVTHHFGVCSQVYTFARTASSHARKHDPTPLVSFDRFFLRCFSFRSWNDPIRECLLLLCPKRFSYGQLLLVPT